MDRLERSLQRGKEPEAWFALADLLAEQGRDREAAEWRGRANLWRMLVLTCVAGRAKPLRLQHPALRLTVRWLGPDHVAVILERNRTWLFSRHLFLKRVKDRGSYLRRTARERHDALTIWSQPQYVPYRQVRLALKELGSEVLQLI